MQGLGGFGFAVGEIGLAGLGWESGEPAKEFAFAGVGGELAHLYDFGFYGNGLAVEIEGFGAVLQGTAAGAFGLKAAEDDAVAGIAETKGEMVKDATAGDHAAGGNNDAGSFDGVDGLGFLDGAGEMEALDVEGIAAVLLVACELQVVIFLVLEVEVSGAEGHGAVNVDGDFGDALQLLELVEIKHKGLRAADGEGGNDDGAAALGDAIDDVGEKVEGIAAGMLAVAVGGFAEEQIDLLGDGRSGVVQDGLIVAADVAGEDDDGLLAIIGDGEFEAGGAEDVAGVVGLDVKVGRDVEAAVARHGAEEFEDRIDIVGGVERNGIGMLAPLVANGVGGVFFLEVGGIFEEESGELDGGGIGENGFVEATADEDGEPAGVVEMGVSEDGEVERFGIDGKRIPVAILEVAGALEKAAIDEQALASGLDEIFGTGDAASSAKKGEFRHGGGILQEEGINAMKKRKQEKI